MFAVDGSKDLTSEQFKKLKNTIKNILNSYVISPTATHVGVIEFSDTSTESVHLTKSYDRDEIYALIDAIKQSGGTRRVTDEALKMAAERMFSVTAGARVGALRALVILTAGKSTGDQSPLEAVKPLERSGVRVYVVSVGENVDGDEVRGIVPAGTNVFPANPDKPGEVVIKIVKVINKDIKESKEKGNIKNLYVKCDVT